MGWDDTDESDLTGYPQFIRDSQRRHSPRFVVHMLQHRIILLPQLSLWQDDTTSHEILLNDFTWLHFPPRLHLVVSCHACRPITGPRLTTFGDYKRQCALLQVGRIIGRHRHFFTLIFLFMASIYTFFSPLAIIVASIPRSASYGIQPGLLVYNMTSRAGGQLSDDTASVHI